VSSLIARRAIGAMLAVAALASVSAAPVHAAALGGFSARPATFDAADPATRAYFKPQVSPGGAFRGSVVIGNPGAAPIKLRVYAADGLTGKTSGAVYANADVARKGAGRWVSPATSTITVPAHSQRQESFVVRVPAGAQPGDHLAGIALQDANPRRSGGHFQITEIFRVVVGIEVEVPGRASASAHLTPASLAALPGTQLASVIIGIGDTGQRLCKPTLKVSLRRAGMTQTVTKRLDTILPGDTIPYPLPWPSTLRPGVYRVAAQATGCGRPATLAQTVRSGGELIGTHPTSLETRAAPKEGGSGNLLLIALAAMALGLTAGVLLGRRGRSTLPRRPVNTDSHESAAEVASSTA
jgi:hypothetical protein